jgi:hypothetical protein
MEASGTLRVTATAPVPTMTTLVPALETPFTRLTEPTVPPMEDFRVAEVRSACAVLKATRALVTAAWSDTRRDAPD